MTYGFTSNPTQGTGGYDLDTLTIVNNGNWDDFMAVTGGPPSFPWMSFWTTGILPDTSPDIWQFQLIIPICGVVQSLIINGNSDPTPAEFTENYANNSNVLKMNSLNNTINATYTYTSAVQGEYVIIVDNYPDFQLFGTHFTGFPQVYYYNNEDPNNNSNPWTFYAFSGGLSVEFQGSTNMMPNTFLTDHPTAIQLNSYNSMYAIPIVTTSSGSVG